MNLVVTNPTEAEGLPKFKLEDDWDTWALHSLPKKTWELMVATTYANEPLCFRGCNRYLCSEKISHKDYFVKVIYCIRCKRFWLRVRLKTNKTKVYYLSNVKEEEVEDVGF